jgi:hypothetical protein
LAGHLLNLGCSRVFVFYEIDFNGSYQVLDAKSQRKVVSINKHNPLGKQTVVRSSIKAFYKK